MFSAPQITFGHATIVSERVNIRTSVKFGAVIQLRVTVLTRTVLCVTKVCVTYSTCYIGAVTRISSRV